MRQVKFWMVGVAAGSLLLAGCGQDRAEEASSIDAAEEVATQAEMASADMASEEMQTDTALPDLDALPVGLPQLAYDYDYNWRLPAEDIGPLQRAHANLCEQQGPASCQIIGMSKTGEEAEDVRGVLEMAVASKQARAFGALLEDEAEDAGGELVSAEIAAEELSKQIVDTEARLRAREKLRDRLENVLETRRGNVEELVEAERSVARVNEEIDQARSWLREMEGRVDYSRMTVRYETGAPVTSDFLKPVAGALGSLGSILGWAVAILIVLGAILLPIGAIAWFGQWFNARMRRRELSVTAD